MPPVPIKAIFTRSRRQLLDAALLHLSDKYYPRLSNNDTCKKDKYVSSRAGELLEGALTFQQDGRHVLVSVTPFDVAHFEKNKDWLQANIQIPQPNRSFVLTESVIAGMIIFIGLFPFGTPMGAFMMGCFFFCVYFAYSVFRAEDLGRELKQSSNLSLYQFIPDCRLPAHENWLVVGDEIFKKKSFIEPIALLNLCRDEGVGLLVILQDDKIRIWNHPQHRSAFIETKYDVRIPYLLNNQINTNI